MRFTVDGREVNATTGGAPLDHGRPLLTFVHGAGGDRTMWSLQTRYFAHHGWSVLAVDLPGHGASAGPVPSSVPAFADWLAESITAVGFERSAVVGHSLGAYIGLELAARRPDMVTRLALVGTAGTMPVHPVLLGAAAADDHLAVDLMTGWSFTSRARLGGHPTPGTWITGRNVRVVERSLDGTLGIDLATSDLYTEAVSTAARVACPVLFVLGEEDKMTRPAGAVDLIDGTPDATVAVLPGTGHMMIWEQPDGVIDTLATFLSRP